MTPLTTLLSCYSLAKTLEVLLNMWPFFLQLRQRLKSATVSPSSSCHWPTVKSVVIKSSMTPVTTLLSCYSLAKTLEVFLNMWPFFFQLRQRLNSATVSPSLSCHCISGHFLAHSEQRGGQVLDTYYTPILLHAGHHSEHCSEDVLLHKCSCTLAMLWPWY